jgi:general secretion pathway protein G
VRHRKTGIAPEATDTSVAEGRQASEAGYTLLELLVVLAILGLLVGLVAPQVMSLLGSSKQKVADQSIARITNILDMYRLDTGAYPTTEQGLAALIVAPPGAPGWNGPYLKGDQVPLDPWGKPFQYRNPSQRPNHSYDLFSLGSDGAPGGTGEAADVINR